MSALAHAGLSAIRSLSEYCGTQALRADRALGKPGGHQVRHQSTRTYVGEAVTAYRAYSAALVALWVAVAYGLVAKLRELAALGDHRRH